MDEDIAAFLAEEEADLNEEMNEELLCSYLDPEKENFDEANLSDAGKNKASWARPLVSNPITGAQSLDFQQIEVDYCAGKPDPDYCEPAQRKLQTVPIVRMYGVTDAGNSVCAFVHGFEPYFYAKCVGSRHSPSEGHIPALTESLNNLVLARASRSGAAQRAVVRVELVKAKSIWNYDPAIMEDGVDVDRLGRLSFSTFESNVLFVLRFMIDTGVVGGCWITAQAGKYSVGGGGGSSSKPKLSTCQIDIHLNYRQLKAHEAVGEWSRMAPFRVMSIDIECLGRKGCFPEADKDPVIQIASVVSTPGAKEPMLHHIVTLGTCSGIPGSQVEAFENESDMLLRWQQLLAIVDPDILIGYNILNFDFPYLVNRAQALKLPAFLHWGRIRGSELRMKDAQFSSKAYGTHAYKDITIEGRVQFDLLTAIQRDHKLSSYSLNSVSAHFLGQQKEDVHHSCIADLQQGTSDTRRRLAIYCLKDALLPLRLFDKLKYMFNQLEMARVTGVPMSFLLTRGQSVKVFCQILRHAQKAGFLCPFLKGGYQADGVAYEGATVLHANTGYYTEPIATLDFASLYPSIMMAHNLCYSTLVPSDEVGKSVPEEHIERTPGGDCFVKSSVCKGLLPQILENLLAARKRAKKDLKAATDPFEKAVLDGRQLALKVSANSVYGFTGATVGKLCCLPISASTTAYGRRMIERTKALVEQQYTKANGYESDCVVIYGDTDSVMVNFKVESLARAMELGEEAAERVTKEFPPPVKLEFEKVYFPYLLMNKKRYAGLLWTNPNTWDKMDTKGIETVRRDNCVMVRKLVTKVLDCLLKDRDLDTAVEHVKTVISDLLLNRVDMSDLVVSKSLSQDAEAYKAAAAHVELSKKMAKRDSATAPQVGERVAFVIIKGAKGAKAHEKAEDPIYALEHNLPIDAQHYLEHHLSLPLLRIFEPILGEKKAKSLLSGDHTRSIQLTTPTASIGGIMRFAHKTVKCMNCKTALPSDRTTLCVHCESKEPEIYGKTVLQAAVLETEYGQLWTQCQRCQGSLHLDVLCTSRDCPIFYRRRKVAKDVNEAQENLARFAW